MILLSLGCKSCPWQLKGIRLRNIMTNNVPWALLFKIDIFDIALKPPLYIALWWFAFVNSMGLTERSVLDRWAHQNRKCLSLFVYFGCFEQFIKKMSA